MSVAETGLRSILPHDHSEGDIGHTSAFLVLHEKEDDSGFIDSASP
jgi:hypothetical protein